MSETSDGKEVVVCRPTTTRLDHSRRSLRPCDGRSRGQPRGIRLYPNLYELELDVVSGVTGSLEQAASDSPQASQIQHKACFGRGDKIDRDRAYIGDLEAPQGPLVDWSRDARRWVRVRSATYVCAKSVVRMWVSRSSNDERRQSSAGRGARSSLRKKARSAVARLPQSLICNHYWAWDDAPAPQSFRDARGTPERCRELAPFLALLSSAH